MKPDDLKREWADIEARSEAGEPPDISEEFMALLCEKIAELQAKDAPK